MTDSTRSREAVLFERYRDPALSLPGQWNETLDVLLAHRSVRRFLDEPVSDDTLAAVVTAAQSASTSSNLQLWSVVAVRDAGRKARLAEYCGNQRHIVEAPLFLVWLADFARLRQLAADHGQPLDGQDFLEAGVLGCVDAALAAQNAAIAAESLGLGTVYIGGIRNRPEDVVAELKLPRYTMPVFGMCVGRPDPAAPAEVKPRLAQRAVLHHEAYDLDAQREEVARYEERIGAFYGEQAMAESWVRRVLARMASGQSLTGRHRLREAWRNQGFELK